MKGLVMLLTDDLVDKYKGKYPQLRKITMGKHYEGFLVRDKVNPAKVLAYCTVQIVSRTMFLEILDGDDSHYNQLLELCIKRYNPISIKYNNEIITL